MAAACAGNKEMWSNLRVSLPHIFMACTGSAMSVQAFCYRFSNSSIIDCNFDILQ